MISDEQTLPPLSAWHALELQLIAFPESPALKTEQQWWQVLSGGADSSSSKQPFERKESGIIDGRSVTLLIDPLRIVWKSEPRTPNPASDNVLELQEIGAILEAKEWWVHLMDGWLADSCPPIKRLAFVAKLMQPLETREDAYRMLNRYLACVSVEPDTYEFQYRLNRRLPSSAAVPDVCINRLAIWSAIKIDMHLQARMGDQPILIHGAQHNGCLLQLDINTSQDRSLPLPAESLVPLWHELSQIGADMAETGDHP